MHCSRDVTAAGWVTDGLDVVRGAAAVVIFVVEQHHRRRVGDRRAEAGYRLHVLRVEQVIVRAGEGASLSNASEHPKRLGGLVFSPKSARTAVNNEKNKVLDQQCGCGLKVITDMRMTCYQRQIGAARFAWNHRISM